MVAVEMAEMAVAEMVEVVATMAPGGATCLLPIVLCAPAHSTRAPRLRVARGEGTSPRRRQEKRALVLVLKRAGLDVGLRLHRPAEPPIPKCLMARPETVGCKVDCAGS